MALDLFRASKARPKFPASREFAGKKSQLANSFHALMAESKGFSEVKAKKAGISFPQNREFKIADQG
jgi:hypothetical protein